MTLSQAVGGQSTAQARHYQGYLAGVWSSSTFSQSPADLQAFRLAIDFLVNVPLDLAAVVLVLRLKTNPAIGAERVPCAS
jgi:hypothetical protein